MIPFLNERGFAVIPGVFSPQECEEWIARLGPALTAGRRGLLEEEAVRELAWSHRFLDLLRPHLSFDLRPVRAIYFNKSPSANWFVPWHQDLTIAIKEQRDLPGFGPWSVKDGVPHVQPPLEVLEEMLTIRLHLDSADETNGALKVIPGSHRAGRLDAEAVAALRKGEGEVTCCAKAGDVLLMRPLLLHASARAENDRQRRVLHIEYCGVTLPEGLEWAEG